MATDTELVLHLNEKLDQLAQTMEEVRLLAKRLAGKPDEQEKD